MESVGGNQDRAVDALLGMSDPDYVPSAQEQAAPVSIPSSIRAHLRMHMLFSEVSDRAGRGIRSSVDARGAAAAAAAATDQASVAAIPECPIPTPIPIPAVRQRAL